MRWFFHRRSQSPPGGTQWYRLLVRAACCVRPTYGACPTMHCQLGWISSFFRFLSLVTLKTFDWPSNSGKIFTMYPIAKFDRPMFSRSEVIVRTNKQTNKQTNRRRWKHPPRFATLRRLINIMTRLQYSCCRLSTVVFMLISSFLRLLCILSFIFSFVYELQTACADFPTA